MKILVIAPTPFFSDRGTHIRILEESLSLERLGHDITIATYHIGRDIPPEIKTDIDVRRIRRWLFWYHKLEAGPDWQKVILDVMLLRKVFFLARTGRPDIIHAHLHEGALIGWVVQKVLFWRNIKLVTDLHGSLTKEMVSHAYLRGGVLRWLFKRIERWINNRGDIATTSSWENTLEVSAMRPSETTETVLDGVNLSYYRSLPMKAEARKKIGLPADRVIVTYTGALVPNKGIRYLLEAIPLVHKACPEVHFVIAGFPLNLIQPLIEGQSWTRETTFISPLPYFDLPCLLWTSDIGIDPKDTVTRQASGKVLQYMGAGLSIACFETTNNRAYLDDGAEYATEVTAESLAEAIIRLVRDKAAREEKGLINRRRAEKFSWNTSAKQLEGIYKKVLQKD
jgi:glycosyltransferase involved in cell wall biosynthesis